MRSLPAKCPKCRERRVVEIVELYENTADHDGRAYSISIPDLLFLKCENCGNRTIPSDSDDRISEALRQAAGLLRPSAIRESRQRLGLTQERMARDLGVAEATLSRWETGAQIQQRAFDKMLRAYFSLTELRQFLSSDCSASETVSQLPATANIPFVPS